MARRSQAIEIFGETIAASTQRTFNIPIGQLYTHTDISIPVQVVNGKTAGPVLLICAAIHGDELNGIEVVRRVLKAPWLKNLRGTLIAVPMVNVLGIIQRSRYLPDRRDLNRCFPGSEKGSLGGRIANLFVQEILTKCQYAIDLHTGAAHRSNMPQIRVHLENQQAAELAQAFGVPLVIDAPIRDGSLRGAGDDLDIPIITYEAGEALRFDEPAIATGVKGVRNVMTHLQMLPPRKSSKARPPSFIARSSSWVRAPADGLFRSNLQLGDRVARGEVLGIIDGPLGGSEIPVTSPFAGIVIGNTNLPLVNEGEALLHLGRFDDIDDVETVVEEFRQEFDGGL
ncbi:MAG: succinylglutamate desuccinylase/aspartoacylase family protein [Pseudomonadota bacterium]|nr:succinylglutamate desuccinylase/aspartoacylase family protein [Pseudomonadota bacterium]